MGWVGRWHLASLIICTLLLAPLLLAEDTPASRESSALLANVSAIELPQRTEQLPVEPILGQTLVQEEYVRVIITLKNTSGLSREERRELRTTAKSDHALRQVIRGQVQKQVPHVTHEYLTLNAFAAEVTAEELEALRANPLVERIEHDAPVRVALDDSVQLSNATGAWRTQIGETNLTGVGRTVCILDTGIDYTHPDLGGCNPADLAARTQGSYSLQSPGYPAQYPANQTIISTITVPGYSRIAVHFTEIDLEYEYDYVCILDVTDAYVACYTGYYADVWSASVEGDTLKVLFISDGEDEGGPYAGFQINATKDAGLASTKNWTGCKIVAGHDFVNSDSDPFDDDGHGTHVAGIAAANGTVRGIAPDATIIAVKVLDSSGTGFTSDVLAGIEYCTSMASQYNISAISMSLGSGDYTTYCDSSRSSYAQAINAAVARNISVVVAAGNDGYDNRISAPACIQAAIPVGATNKDGSIAAYSNRNALVQLMAPGSDIFSTQMGGGVIGMSGTSMAAPHVAGAIAIMDQYATAYGQKLAPSKLETTLNRTGARVSDHTGLNYSRINIGSAVVRLDESAPSIALSSPLIQNTAAPLIDFVTDGTGTDLVTVMYTAGSTVYVYNATLNTANCTQQRTTLHCINRLDVLPEGNAVLQINSTDAGGNTNASFWVMILDATAPAITNISSASVARSNASILLRVNVTEQNLVTIKANNQALSCAGSLNYACSGSVIVGNGTISIEATDVTGSIARNTTTVIIDDEAPAVSAIPTGSSRSRMVNITATDHYGVQNVSVTGIGGFDAMSCTGNSTHAACAFNATPLVQGNNSFTIISYDAAGNRAAVAASFIYDTVGPTITAGLSPSTSAQQPAGNITLDYSASDLHDALGVLWFVLDGGSPSALNISHNSRWFDDLPAGQHTITLYANDTLGNTANVTLAPFYVLAPVNLSKMLQDLRHGAVADAAIYLDGARITDGLHFLNRTLQQEIIVNSTMTDGVNISLNITVYGNLLTTGNADKPLLIVNTSDPVSVAATTGLGRFDTVVLFENMSLLLADDSYADAASVPQWVVIHIGAPLAGRSAAYIDDSLAAHRLSQCAGNAAPTPPSSLPGCYVNGSAVDIYIPHFSGAGLLSAANAPSYVINSPAAEINDSKLILGGNLYDLDLNTSSCIYAVDASENFSMMPSLVAGSTNYSFSITPAASAFLWNMTNASTHNITISCASLDANRSVHTAQFLVRDVVAPAPAVSVATTTSSATITLTGNYEEFNFTISLCGRNMSGNHSSAHTAAISGLASSTTYAYNLTVCDRTGNCQLQELTLSTTAPAPVSSGGGGGGGGGGGAGGGGSIATLSAAMTNRTLSTVGSFSFALPGSMSTYQLSVKNIGADKVTIGVHTQTVTLFTGDAAPIDLNKDGVGDIEISLLGMTQRTATLGMRLAPKITPAIVQDNATAPTDNAALATAPLTPPIIGTQDAASANTSQAVFDDEQETERSAGYWWVALVALIFIAVMVYVWFAVKK